MRYWALTLLGIGTFVACLVTFCLKITTLLDTGTCASGGPYVIARECPEGTTLDALLLTGSIIGLFVAAGFILAAGDRPNRRGPGSLILVHGWGIFFAGSGGVTLIHSLTSDVIGPDGKLGGIIVGITFLLMGLPAVWMSFADLGSAIRRRDERPTLGPAATGVVERGVGKIVGEPVRVDRAPRAKRPPPGAGASANDARLDQLERLGRLRESGTLTEAEFAREKARMLGS